MLCWKRVRWSSDEIGSTSKLGFTRNLQKYNSHFTLPLRRFCDFSAITKVFMQTYSIYTGIVGLLLTERAIEAHRGQSNILCMFLVTRVWIFTSGFVDDVMFAHNGQAGDAKRASCLNGDRPL